MRSPWLRAVLVGGIALLSLSACSDSSDVGLGVGPDSLRGGQPVTLDLNPDLDTTHTTPVTGYNDRQPPVQDAWRFLVGVVDDPVPGTGVVEAEGYIDFSGRSSLPSEIITANDPDSLAAELRLTRETDYLHGISNESMDVTVFGLTQEADMDSARANASFDTDEIEPVSVDTAQITLTDSVATIRLRQSWISRNLEILRNTRDNGAEFEDNFHGFKIVAPNSQAVVGFSSLDATLRLIYEPDSTTADYQGLKSFTHIEQRNVTSSPLNTHKLLQDGVGIGLTMNWTFNERPIDTLQLDTLQNAPLNRAEIFVPVDKSALREQFSEPNFVRPLPKGYRITATRASASGPSTCTAVRLPVSSGACILPSVLSADTSAALVPDNVAFPVFQRSFQRVRQGQVSPFTEYRADITDQTSPASGTPSVIRTGLPSTLPVLVPVDGNDPGPPRATLTVTPL